MLTLVPAANSLYTLSLCCLLHRSANPPYGFFVLNRNGVENFSANLDMSDDLELTTEFIIYRASEGKHRGARRDSICKRLSLKALIRRRCHWHLDIRAKPEGERRPADAQVSTEGEEMVGRWHRLKADNGQNAEYTSHQQRCSSASLCCQCIVSISSTSSRFDSSSRSEHQLGCPFWDNSRCSTLFVFHRTISATPTGTTICSQWCVTPGLHL